MPPAVPGLRRQRPGAYSYVSGEVSTLATARMVGILAYASTIYAAFDPVFAQRLRDAAWWGWRYLEARPSEQSDGPMGSAFRQDDDLQSARVVQMFAAAGMLLAVTLLRWSYDPKSLPRWLRAFTRARADHRFRRAASYFRD